MNARPRGWHGNGCESCGDEPLEPCSAHWTNAYARNALRRYGYTAEQIEAWLVANADRPGAQVPA